MNTDRPLKILMIQRQGGGVMWWRHTMPARALRRAGHEVFYRDDVGDGTNDLDVDKFLLEKADWADVIVSGWATDAVYVGLLAACRNYAAKALNKSLPLITDIDDDVLHVPTYNISFKGYTSAGEYRKGVLWHLRNSDSVTVSMPRLADHYARYARHIDVLPNCFDPGEWEGLPHDPRRADDASVRIMFAGGIGRKGDLDAIREPLESVMRQRPQARLIFQAMIPDWAVENWAQSDSDPAANRAFFVMPSNVADYKSIMSWVAPDICLAPVETNEFARSKSEIKVIDAAMVGAATVCSDWDTYAAVPNDAVLKCSTPIEWSESLLALIDDVELRRRKATRAKEWAIDARNIDKSIHLWENAYASAMQRPVIGDDGEHMPEMPDPLTKGG